MCGIVAAIAIGADRIDEAALARATTALASRGPDGEGLWTSQDRRVGLGHRRLALVDVEGGQQPLLREPLAAVVNGEFYDHHAHRRRLGRHRFRTGSDSELLLTLYEDRGLEALDRLRGEFAFVLWDDHRLWAARDRFGVKPLYTTILNGVLWIASRASALLAAGAPARWNRTALARAMALQYPPPHSSLFAGIEVLEPGVSLVVENSQIRRVRQLDLDYPTAEARGEDRRTEDELCAELRGHFDEAVRLRLGLDRDDGSQPTAKVAFQLSGGIDSSAVLASARPHLHEAHAFTLQFSAAGYDPIYDERAQAEAIAAHTDTELHVVRVTPEHLVQHFEAATFAGEGLMINGHGIAKYRLARAIHEAGFRIALTGEGADEVLAGYAHLRADLGMGSSTNQASRGSMLPTGAQLPLDAISDRLGFVPTWLCAKASLGLRTQDFWREPPAFDRGAALLADFDLEGQLEGRSRVDQSLYLWSKLALESYILRTLGDGMEMAHSVEGRLPFLDPVWFAWTLSLDPAWKIRLHQGRLTEKYLLRAAMRDRLPSATIWREKHPLLAPPMLSDPRCKDYLMALTESTPAFFDAEVIRQRIVALETATPEARVAAEPALFLALSACAMQRVFGLEAA